MPADGSNRKQAAAAGGSAGQRFRDALAAEKPLQVVGATTAAHALLAQQAGFRAIYLSGGGVSASSLGVPDLAIIQLEDVLIDARRIAAACDLPMLVDIDTGFGPSAFNIARTVRSLEATGVAGVHIEDQAGAKRCGHRPNKELVSKVEMTDRIQAAVNARRDAQFVIMARTDAIACEGLEAALERADHYVAAGADMLFVEAAADLQTYEAFAQRSGVPILANMTEFGATPLFTSKQLASAGVSIALYPLSAFRAGNWAAEALLRTIRADGTQSAALGMMQTREQLYRLIGYHAFEQELDHLLQAPKK
jgi:methylisocitrate lyase